MQLRTAVTQVLYVQFLGSSSSLMKRFIKIFFFTHSVTKKWRHRLRMIISNLLEEISKDSQCFVTVFQEINLDIKCLNSPLRHAKGNKKSCLNMTPTGLTGICTSKNYILMMIAHIVFNIRNTKSIVILKNKRDIRETLW